MTRLYISGSENVKGADVSKILQLFMDKVSESYRFVTHGPPLPPVHATLDGSCLLILEVYALDRSPTKRCKERCLEEANQLLRQLPDESLRGLGENHLLLLLVRLLLSMQLHTASISTACRKVDQVSPPTPSARCLLHFNQKLTPLPHHLSSTDVAAFGRCQPTAGLWWNSALSAIHHTDWPGREPSVYLCIYR